MVGLRRATLQDAQKIYNVMQTVAYNMEDKSLFVCDDLDFVKSHINDLRLR